MDMHTHTIGHHTDVYTGNTTGLNTNAYMDGGGQNIDVYTGASIQQHTDVYADNASYIHGYPQSESVYSSKFKRLMH